MKRKLMIVILGLVLMTSLVVANVVISRKNLDSEVELPIDIKETLENHRIISPEFTVDKSDDYWLVHITSEGFNSPNNQIEAWHKVCVEEDVDCNEWERRDYTDEEMELKVDKFIDAKLKRVGEGLKARDDKAGLEPYAEGTKTLKSKSLLPF